MATTEVMEHVMEAAPAHEIVTEETPIKKELGTEDFDPKKHIDFHPPTQVHSMSDLKLPEGTGVSPFAVSEPFQLFTEEAVKRMRAEIFSKPVWDNCQYSSNLAQCQLRGFADK